MVLLIDYIILFQDNIVFFPSRHFLSLLFLFCFIYQLRMLIYYYITKNIIFIRLSKYTKDTTQIKLFENF